MELERTAVTGNEKRLIFCTGLLAWTITLFCLGLCSGFCSGGEAIAAPSVAVTGKNMAWSQAVTLELSDFADDGKIMHTIDPNFKGDGRQAFTGIPLPRLLGMAGLDTRYGLTVIGSDQYVGYLTPERIAQGMLVWEMAGAPISGLKGGPLKMMFPEEAGVHASCFTWYVAAIVQDRPAQDALTVVAGGREKKYAFPDLAAASSPLPAELVSIAQGCRNEFSEATSDKPARAVPFSQLTGDLSGDLSGASSIELIPYYGPAVRLRPEALAFDALVIVGCGSNSLHPALGGPYAIVFPVEEHHQLKGLVPESGAFFFVKSIVIK